MIRRLKVKFVALATVSVFALLCLIVAGMNLINYREVVRESDEILSFLSQNRGTFPIFGEGKEDRLPHGMSPELPYESRFFSVLLTDSGEVIHTETSRIKQVDTEEAIQYAQKVLTDKNGLGFVENYRFMRNIEGNTIRITFLDCGRRLDTFQYFLFVSCLMALVGLVAVFFVILIFSGRIIRPAAESYDKQKQFITDAGHELKTPLTIIKADVDILAMELGENEWLDDIQKQADRLSSLTGDLVLLSRMEEAENAMEMIEFPFSEVVSETAASFQALAQTQDKPFECRIQPMLSMNGNEKAIRQLVGILLDNALKYSPEHSVVSLTAEKRGRTIRLCVFNTTENQLPDGDLNVLFERFYRTDPSRSSQTGGYGIGLSVAKAITAAHNGKIRAATQDGRSLEITVLLPA